MKLFSQKLRSSTDFYSQIALILVIVLLINIIFSFLPLRFDATEAKTYSISSVTKDTLQELDDIVTIKGYFTKDLPGYLITVRQQVQDILAEYKNYGSGNIRVTFVNPNKDQKLEQEARGLGIPPIRFNVVEKDKFEVAQGYLGIAVLYGNKSEILPVVQDTATLEYDLTSSIKKVISGKNLRVGILEKEGVVGPQGDMEILQQALAKQFAVETVNLADGNLIKDDITTLIVSNPVGEFSQRELYIIDQFIMSGRGVLVTAGGVIVEQGLVPKINGSNIFDLLQAYQITINKDLVFDPVSRGQASFSQGFFQFFVPYGFWPKITKTGFSKDSVLVNKLESITLQWPSSIKVDDNSNWEKLAQTTPQAFLIKDNFNLSPQGSPQSNSQAAQTVAVQSKGALDSNFDTVADGKDGKGKEIIQSVDKARLVVVADGTIATDMSLKRYDSNLIFIQNIIDGLTLDESLAAIRSKAVTERPIKELDDTARGLVKYGNIVGVPILVILFAAVRFVWRRKSQRVGTEL